MSFLLDTNVISEARKPQGNARVKAWITAAPADALYRSVLVVGEVQRGVALLRRRDPRQAAIYEAWLAQLRQDYADHILPITLDIAEEWGRLNVPNPVPVVDGLLAATARVRRLVLVTRNTADLQQTRVQLLNPFDPVG